MNRRAFVFGGVGGCVAAALSCVVAPKETQEPTAVANNRVTMTGPLNVNINGVDAEEFMEAVAESVRLAVLSAI